ncbi:MAG: protein kinase [Myxococcota bacterium]
MRLEIGQTLDRYKVENLIGEGGFSVVYRVRHTTLGTDHALKLLKIRHPEFRERMLQEGRVQAKLSHPNVVSVRDVIEIDDIPGLILDLVEGGTLEQLLDNRRPAFADIDDLGQGILRGVQAAHELGLVHRDLKPANVLLEVTPERVEPKVADFGLARLLLPGQGPALGSSPTRSSVIMGTPHYMSPEQIEQPANIDARSDLFSLGAVLYELASGQPAFVGEKVADVIYNVANVRYAPLEEVAPELPERVRRAVHSALQADPAARVQSAAELLAMWRGEPAPVVVSSGFEQGRRLGLSDSFGTGSDDSPTLVPAPRSRPTPRARQWKVLAIAGLGAALGAALVLLLFGNRNTAAPPPPSAIEARTVSPQNAPLPVAIYPSPVELAGPPAPPPGPAETPVPAPPSRVAPPSRPLGAPKEPPPKPAPQGAVRVTGSGVTRVDLVRRLDGAKSSPGDSVPTGLYDLVVWFEDEPAVPIELGLRVRDGERWTVACDASFYTCRVRGAD